MSVDFDSDIRSLKKDIKTIEFWQKLRGIFYRNELELFKKLLAHGMDINERLARDWTPLMTASLSSGANPDIALWIIRHGGDVTLRNEDGETALLCDGVYSDDKVKQVVEILLDNGADINAVSSMDGTGILNNACCVREKKYVEHLLDRGADVNITDKYGNNCLAAVCYFVFTEKARLLIKRGIDVTHLNNDGENCLMTGCERQKTYPALLELVLSHGVDINHVSNKGWRIPDYLASWGKGDACLTVLTHPLFDGTDKHMLDNIIMQGAVHGGLASFAWAAEHGGNLDQIDCDTGRSVFETAKYDRQNDIVKYLKSIGITK
jgi:ankyrin repeat protein